MLLSVTRPLSASEEPALTLRSPAAKNTLGHVQGKSFGYKQYILCVRQRTLPPSTRSSVYHPCRPINSFPVRVCPSRAEGRSSHRPLQHHQALHFRCSVSSLHISLLSVRPAFHSRPVCKEGEVSALLCSGGAAWHVASHVRNFLEFGIKLPSRTDA